MRPRRVDVRSFSGSEALSLGDALEPSSGDTGSHSPPHDPAQAQRADKTTIRPPVRPSRKSPTEGT